MSESDEYDAYFSPLEPEDYLAIDAITARALSRDNTPDIESLDTPQPPRRSPPSPDEFDAYDFSEFTAEDFELIDKLVLASQPHSQSPATTSSPIQAAHTIQAASSGSDAGTDAGRRAYGTRGNTSTNGGPRIEIAMERAAIANRYRSLKDSRDSSSTKRSPYEQFRAWNRVLSVTDLASPSWCEVQFDYGLRQKRHTKLEKRPASFVTSEGKTITVAQTVAASNDRTITRGKSVHKVLEREIQPEEIQVDITTIEERWALRIVNLLNSLSMLMEQGRCREIPVFGFVHDQLVTGIIDEIVREPIRSIEDPTKPVTRSSPNKRPPPTSTPSTPSHSSSKKSRQEVLSDQPRITQFLSPTKSKRHNDDTELSAVEEPTTPVRGTAALPMADNISALSSSVQYALHLSDTKTRKRPSLPPDEDTFASRVQLMLYHRLLSSLVAGLVGETSSHLFDFHTLWQRAGVDPTRKFSDKFLLQIGFPGSLCLNDLSLEWRHAVDRLNVTGIDNTLTLVYRHQPKTRRSGWEGKQKDRPTVPNHLSDQEAQALAAAVQASINDAHPGSSGYEADLQRAIAESLRESVQSGKAADGDLGVLTHPFGPPISDAPGSSKLEGERSLTGAAPEPLAGDPELAWVLQQSLLPRLEQTPALKEAIEEGTDSGVGMLTEVEPNASVEVKSATAVEDHPAGAPHTAPSSPAPMEKESDTEEEAFTAAELETKARILGTKEFEVDDAFLDEYLTRVLAWWHGQRPPQGVDVELTRRCVTCEYRDGCEWREKKSQEALDKYQSRMSSSPPVQGPSEG